MKVSICCITYNHEKFIADALDGFLAQEFSDEMEIVISDDASTDNTPSILKSYKERYPHQIKLLLNNSNIGMMPNFIQALGACSGQYIAFCEGDDYWTDSLKLQKQVDIMDRNESCTITWTNFQREENGVLSPNEFDVKYTEGLYKVELSNVFRPYVTLTLTSILRQDVLDIKLLRKMRYAKDNTLYVMALTKGYGLLMEDVTAVYRVHEGGAFSMKTNFFQSFSSYLNFKEIVRHYPQLLSMNNFTEVRRGLFYFSFKHFFSERHYLKFRNKYVLQFLRNFFSRDSFLILRYFFQLKCRAIIKKLY